MPWKEGHIKFDDGSVYPAELLVNDSGEVWNVKVHSGNDEIQEVDVQGFAKKLNKTVEDVYPFTYTLD